MIIRKIKTSEYLRKYDDLTADERAVYEDRVGRWLKSDGRRLLEITERPMAKAQNIILLGSRWDSADERAFHEGTVLLSALAGRTDTWLPSALYAKAAYRAVRRMYEALSSELPHREKDGTADGTRADSKNTQVTRGNKEDVTGTRQAKKAEEQTTAQTENPPVEYTKADVIIRPKHIDQYVRLLPEETKKRASMVKGLLRELDTARENMRLLTSDAHANPDACARWARKATSIDNKLHSIYAELDIEWEKLVKSGGVSIDSLGNVSVANPSKESSGTTAAEAVQCDSSDAEYALTSVQKSRRRELRKWLIDIRRGNGHMREKRVRQWEEYWVEYLTLEPLESALKDEKIVAAARHFDINIEPANSK